MNPGKFFKYAPGEILLAVVSGALIGLSMTGYDWGWLAWVGLIPLFAAIHGKGLRSSFGLGLIAGFSEGVFIARWTLWTVPRYMGFSGIGKWMIYLTLATSFALWIALSALLSSLLTNPSQPEATAKKTLAWLRFLAVPSVWVMFEFLHEQILSGVPWTFFFLGYSQWRSPALIQFARIGGVFGVSFWIVFVNYMLFAALSEVRKSPKNGLMYLMIGASAFAMLYVTGRTVISSETEEEHPVQVAVLQENLPAEVRWTKESGDAIVEIYYLSLAREAVRHSPNLILWTETAIPWDISEDDDLIYAALNITYPAQAGHIIGIKSPAPGKSGKMYNSVFYIHPDGAITGQYNKMNPLLFIETSFPVFGAFGGLRIPALVRSGADEVEPGTQRTLLATPYGQAGVTICNEACVATPARQAVAQGADFLVVMSNDGWFRETLLPLGHFAVIVFRAVENGRDIAVASNGGYSGFIHASGRIRQMARSDTPECLIGTVSPKRGVTFYTRYGNLFAGFCIVMVMFSIILHREPKGSHKTRRKK